MDLHPSVKHVLRLFNCAHLPTKLYSVAIEYKNLAHDTATRAPQCPETTVGAD